MRGSRLKSYARANYLPISYVADCLGCDPKTVRAMAARGDLEITNIGGDRGDRVTRESWKRFVNSLEIIDPSAAKEIRERDVG